MPEGCELPTDPPFHFPKGSSTSEEVLLAQEQYQKSKIGKYGTFQNFLNKLHPAYVDEHGQHHDSEPWFVFRAQDKFLPDILKFYCDRMEWQIMYDQDKLTQEQKEKMRGFIEDIHTWRRKVMNWQIENQDKVKVPD